jgi:hypothetical protein
MIVLYENTNVIEVYIQEKNIDNFGAGTWNNGNAIVGVQDPTGTIATVAPNRNGLDANWTAINEAWRFVPDGTSITSIAWHEGSGTSGPIISTADQINVCPTTTTTYTAEVTYQLCGGAILTELDETTVTVNESKIWNGSISTDWNNANNWTPAGVPTTADCVIIPDVTNDPIVNGNGFGLNLSIYNNANMTITSNNTATITDRIDINAGGSLFLQNNASLIQINNVSNSGTMTMDREANIKQYDYVYWSSPVANFSLSNIIGSSKYKWEPTLPTAYASNFGNWVSTSENMTVGKGYIVRAPNNYTSSPQIFTATFTGTPNNGDINIPIERGTYDGVSYTGPTATPINREDDNWNLVGNPYPSAIDAIDFLTLNTNINGFIKVWTHGTLPSTSFPTAFYENYTSNYDLSDYITYNISGSSSGPDVFGGYIAAGQGFFVLMNHTSASTTENLIFNNSLRSNAHDNSEFYRSSNSSQIEKNRIWLDLIDQNNNSARTLVGYITNATDNIDRLYDAPAPNKNNFDIYTLNQNQRLNIQGRTLPFNETDLVPLGIYLPQIGNYSIGIGTVDGLFENPNQNIYIEDLQTGIIHDLRTTPYSFTSNDSGNIDNRFVLRYTNSTLDNSDFITTENEIIVLTSDNLIVKSTRTDIESIKIYDILGRNLASIENVNSSELTVQNLQKNNTTLIVQIKLTTGIIINKKVIF